VKVLLVSRLDDGDALGYCRDLAKSMREAGDEVLVEERTARLIGLPGIPLGSADADMVIVIGGDGSVLLTVQKLSRQIPVIGINWGQVGFLTDLEPDEAYRFFDRARLQGWQVEPRMRITISVDGQRLGDVLNEALIVTTKPSKMLKFSVRVDGILAEQFRADGFLVSTPTGSTAYAMSAGGPIVDPRIEGFLLVPIAPYLLSSRPHLISCDRQVSIVLEGDKTANLVLDGQKTIELGAGSTLDITRAADPAVFVNVGQNFFTKIDSKLRRL
jgi:NAD+ kinase